MRRAELIEGIEEVGTALRASRLQLRLRTLFFEENRGEKSGFQEKLLEALKTYAVRAERFEAPARRLVEAVDLDELERPATWVQLLGTADRRHVRLLHERIQFVADHLPELTELLASEPFAGEAGLPFDDAQRLSIVLVEQEGWPCTSRRVRTALESIEQLYDYCSTIAGIQPDPLVMTACDSGREKVFDLLGTPDVVEAVRVVVLEVWDRVVFHRHQPPAERTQQALASLPVLERVERLRQNGTLSPEQAELLRRGVRESITSFLNAGAIIPDLEEHARFDPRVLMGPEPRLLADRSGRARLEPDSDAPGRRDAAPNPERATSKPWRINDEIAPRRPDVPAEDQAVATPSGENRIAKLLDNTEHAAGPHQASRRPRREETDRD